MTLYLIVGGIAAIVVVLVALNIANNRRLQRTISGKPPPPPPPTRTYRAEPAPLFAARRSAAELWRTYAAEAPAIGPGFAGSGAAAISAPAAVETWAPARPPTVESDVIVPAFQSLITAALAALVAGVAAWGLAFPAPGRVAAGMFTAALMIVWLWRLNVVSSLLEAGERITGRDINGDGKIGGPHAMYKNLPGSPPPPAVAKQQRLHQFVEDAAEHGCTAAQLRRHGWSNAEWTEMRDHLLKIGAAKPAPQNTWQLAVTPEAAHTLVDDHIEFI